MIRTLIATATLLATPALADGHATGTTGYALTEGGRGLVVIADLAAPADGRAVPLAHAVDAIAFRPVTGKLLGLSNAEAKLYTVDPADGSMTDLGASFLDGAAIDAGEVTDLDFNNAIDAVRAVSGGGTNLVYFPGDFGDDKAGSVRRFADLAYAEGDAHADTAPEIFANAYTNAVPGAKASSTAQFALDAGTDALVTLANNAGTLATVGPVTVEGRPMDVAAAGGFDIVSAAEGQDAAYALLRREGETTAVLYALDLATGAATPMGDTGLADVTGFAARAN